jgi:hypothetical protein
MTQIQSHSPSSILSGPLLRFDQPDKRSIARIAIRVALLLAMPLLSISRPAFGQALPTAEAAPISTGFELPRTNGTLTYSIGANESISSGYYGSGVFASTGVNGNVAYISPSKLDPFSMVFSGGSYWATSGQPNTFYLNLGLSQVLALGRWNFVASDSVNYLPQTPSIGLSGIPGTGDLGVPPVQVGDNSGQGVLTGNASRVNNTAALSASRGLTGKTSIQFSGSYSVLRFLGSSSNEGLDSDGGSGSVGISHRINARNSYSGNYAYSEFSYGSNQPGFASQTASASYSHQFSRKLSMNVSAGPQWSKGTGSQNTSTSTSLYASASLNYSAQFSNFVLGYSRGVNSGFGVTAGAYADSVHFGASRNFARVWNGAVSASYTRTTSLASSGTTSSFAPQTSVVGGQISRAIVKTLSTYASYTLENQATQSSTGAVNLFSGLFQVVGFGITYSPASIHVGSR